MLFTSHVVVDHFRCFRFLTKSLFGRSSDDKNGDNETQHEDEDDKRNNEPKRFAPENEDFLVLAL